MGGDDDIDDEVDGGCDFDAWARTFRAAAEADDFAIFRDHLRRLGLPDEPLLLLEGTIHFVVMWASFASLDQPGGFDRLLAMQTYDPEQATDSCYCFTFDLCGRAYARVLVDTGFKNLDLADMNSALWNEYQVAGYTGFWISHPDWSPLDDDERTQLEDEVTDDLYFDYGEDELSVWFEDWCDETPSETFLRVHVQENDDTD